MKIAVMQPYLFPYLGYFQLAAAVDRFVFFDDVNYIPRGWINRNRILLNGAPHSFTVPVLGASQNVAIMDIRVNSDDCKWQRKLTTLVRQAYARAPFLRDIMPLLEDILCSPETGIGDMAARSVMNVFRYLGGGPEWQWSSQAHGETRSLKAQDRILAICKRAAGSAYLNPPNGKPLYHGPDFRQAGLDLYFLDPVLDPYPQASKEFVPALSILDLLMSLPPHEVMERVRQHVLEPASQARCNGAGNDDVRQSGLQAEELAQPA